MHDLPTTFEKWKPRIIAIATALCGAVALALQNDPHYFDSVGFPAGAGALFLLWWMNRSHEDNEKKSAVAMPPPPVDSDGRQLTRIEQYIAAGIIRSQIDGDDAMVDYLKNAPLKRPTPVVKVPA